MSARVRIASRAGSPLRKRDLLMLSCAAAGLAVVGPQKARAQGFQGDITGYTGIVDRIGTGETSELITIGSQHAVIDWSPYDSEGSGTIDFLPSGHSVTFTNNPELTGNYIALNRIVPVDSSRPIALNGNIVSQIQDFSQGASRGGNVWFYSPGGIMVGATAVIDVGGLLLTTNDFVNFSSDPDFTSIQVNVAGDSASNAAVHIQSGAQINALANNSYVAVVAPRVIQDGNVRVDGSVAYVAAQAATLSVNHGLFDIQVDVGTGDANGIVHTGTTGGPASTGAGDNHGIYMVAVPKNQVLATFLTGNVGFDAATNASVENGIIVLSAGYNVASSAGQTGDALFWGSGDDAADPLGTGSASFHIDTGHYSSDVIGRAGQHIYSSGLNGSTVYDGDVTLIGRVAAHINARNGNDISIAGNAIVTNGFGFGYDDRSATGGAVLLHAEEGSTLSIGGNATADASVLSGIGQSATGGEANLHSGGGDITIGGSVQITADATAIGTVASEVAGGAQGGSASIGATAGGSIDVEGNVNVSAQAIAGVAQEGNGGVATGGSATLFNDASAISILGAFNADAGAVGGVSLGGGAGGSATGGTAGVGANNGANHIGGFVSVSALGSGGGGAGSSSGGAGTGGDVWTHVSGTGELSTAGITLAADGVGGATSGSGAAGSGTGGTARLQVDGGSVDVAGTALVHAVGHGGSGGNGGDGHGGNAFAFATGGDLSVGSALQLAADGVGGNAVTGSGGDGTGGYSQIYVQDAALEFASASIATNGIGGSGSSGGSGFGGLPTTVSDDTPPDGGTFVSVRNGSITGGSLIATANAIGGAGTTGVGGNAAGGSANVTALNGTSTGLIDLASVTVESNGTGGAGGTGANGGIGQGGGSYLLGRAVNGVVAADNVTIQSIGTGGVGGANASGTGGAGGAGLGGFTNFGTASGTVSGSQLEGYANFGSVDVDVGGAGGAGGSGNVGGAGGVGVGGHAALLARGSAVTANTVDISAQGTGGLGGLSADATSRGDSGTGVGGLAAVVATNVFQGTAPGTVDVGSFAADASGIAVAPGAGTQAGGVTIEASTATVQIGSVEAVANGAGPRNITGTDAFGDPFTLTALQSGMTAANGTIRVTNDAQFTTGASINIASNSGGLIDIGDALTLTATDGVDVAAIDGGQVSVGGMLSATSGISASGERGSVNISTMAGEGGQTGPAGIQVGALSVNSSEDVEILGVEAEGGVTVHYNDDVELGNLAANSINVRLGSSLEANAEGYTAEISGLVSAPTISIESGDLIIEEGGQLGEAGVTTSLELIARSFGDPILVGGNDLSGEGESGQYVLSQADAERIEAAAITFRATSNSSQQSPQVIVRDLTIQGSAGEGTTSVLLTTPGSIRVEGDVSYIDAAASDALRIVAGERLEVITPDGSIRMVGSDGRLSGMLTLQSPNVVVANAALAAQLAENLNFSGRDAALATNNGPVNEAGYLEAGGMQLLTSGNIFIQNSGTATQFAGLTVGGQGLLVGRYQASTNPDGTQTFSFTGTLTTADDVLYFDFTITAESEIILRSYSYAGGTNGNGQQIPAGGFDPILSLFNAAGELIDSNDDGGSNVPTDPTTGNNYDVFLESLLPAGSYRVAVTAYSNFPAGDNLSDGWEGGGDFDGRTANFAFDVMGADSVTMPGDENPITVIGFGRMQNADGSFTSGADFFNQVNFSTDSGVEYVQGSSFNGFAIGQAVPPPTPGPIAPPAVTGSDAVLGGVAVVGSGSDAEPEDSDDGSGVGVNTSSGLISTGSAGADELLDEAVTSGGDTSQWVDDECLPEDDRAQCKEGSN